MLGEDETKGARAKDLGESGVEEGGVLVCMQDLEASSTDLTRQPPGGSQIHPRLSLECEDFDALLAQLLAERADAVEAQDHRRDAVSQGANRLRHQCLGTGDVHRMDYEADPDPPTR